MNKTHLTDDEFSHLFLTFVFLVSVALIVLDANFEIFGLQENQFVNAVAYLFLALLGFLVSYFAMFLLYFAYESYDLIKLKEGKCEK